MSRSGPVLGLVLAILGLVACGAEPRDDRQAIRATVNALQEALAAGDMEAACDELSEDAQRHVGNAAHDPPTTCERDLVPIYRGLEKGRGLRDPSSRAIESVAVRGDRGEVMVRASGPAIAVPVARDDGDWKVDAILGALPAGLQEDNFVNPGFEETRADPDTPPPPARQPRLAPARAVTVSREDGGESTRCGELTAEGGGCEGPFVLSDGQVEFTIQTVGGDMPFARCLYNYSLRIGGDGRTRMDRMISAGENPCNDVRPCVDRRQAGWLPWNGRIVRLANGGYQHRVDACVDTCLGQFKGPLVMRLTPRGRAWRATIDRTQVGASGYTIADGSWDWKIPGLKIAPAGR